MDRLMAAAEITIARVSGELDQHISHVASELFWSSQGQAAPSLSSKQVQPVAAPSISDLAQASSVSAQRPILHCRVTPNQPLACRVAHSRLR